MNPLLAAEIPDYMLLPLKILALIGVAALGGMLLGWIAALITRTYFAQTIPPRMAWFIRTLGAVTCGLIAWWVLFHGGGSGIGGSGGWWPGGSGEGTKDAAPKDGSKKDDKKDKEKEKEKAKSGRDEKDRSKVPAGVSLAVEVLGDPTLSRLAKGKEFDAAKRYRVQGTKELLTLKEVRQLILKRRTAEPPLRLLEIVLDDESPARNRPYVADLEQWAKELPEGEQKLRVKVGEED
jgi:hypothetical protein